MFDKAVICTDLTSSSDRLVDGVQGLKPLGVNEVVLTHVTDVFGTNHGRHSLESDAAFSGQVDRLEGAEFTVHVAAPLGHPAFALREVSKEHRASVIVVGSHRSGVFGGPFEGSVFSDLMVLSTTPVLIAGVFDGAESETPVAQPDLLSHVLLATDFSDRAMAAFGATEQMAALGAGRFTLLHVQEIGEDVREAARREADRRDTVRLCELQDRLLDAGAARVETLLVHGSPADELSSRTTNGEYSLIVVGARGRSEREDAVLGGVSDSAARATRTPMLVVPAEEVAAES